MEKKDRQITQPKDDESFGDVKKLTEKLIQSDASTRRVAEIISKKLFWFFNKDNLPKSD